MILSRFVALSVSLIQKVSLFQYGLAIAFDGDDGLVVDASKMAAVSIQQVTMAAWVKGESSGNDGTTFESSMGVIMNKEVTYGAYSRIRHDG